MLFLDSSVVIPYVAAMLGDGRQRVNPRNKAALAYIRRVREPMKINVAVYAETLRHYHSAPDVVELLAESFPAPLPLGVAEARRWARLQEKTGMMGDNDAWVAVHAEALGAAVVGHDSPAFKDRPGVRYLDFMQA